MNSKLLHLVVGNALLPAWLILAASLAEAQLPKPERTVFSASRVEVQLDMINLLPLVEVKVADVGQYRFFMDTGMGGICVLDDLLAKSFHIKNEVSVWDGSAGSVIKMPIVRVHSLSISDFQIQGCLATIMDMDNFRTDFSFHGMLGFRAFTDCQFTLDFPGKRLVLLKEGKEEGGKVYPFMYHLGSPIIQLPLEGEDVAFMLDSGSTRTALPRAMEESFEYHEPPVLVSLMSSASGNQLGRAARLKGTLALGGVDIKDPVVWVGGEIGLIGMDFLRFFSLTFNQRKMKVWIQAASNDPIPTPSLYYAGFGALPWKETRMVGYVLPNSPADIAGLHVNDLILSVNGKKASEYDNPTWRALFKKPGKLHLEVERGEMIFEMEVAVKVVVE